MKRNGMVTQIAVILPEGLRSQSPRHHQRQKRPNGVHRYTFCILAANAARMGEFSPAYVNLTPAEAFNEYTLRHVERHRVPSHT